MQHFSTSFSFHFPFHFPFPFPSANQIEVCNTSEAPIGRKNAEGNRAGEVVKVEAPLEEGCLWMGWPQVVDGLAPLTPRVNS